jgi:hypothetical protein
VKSRVAAVALLFAGGAPPLAAAQTVTIQNAGTGAGTEILAAALQAPHTAILAGSPAFTVARGVTIDKTIIAVGRDVVVNGAVQGDVIVVNAGLYLHPGSTISGRAVAIGGQVYNSTLARVGAAPLIITDFTYDVSPTPGGVALSYRSDEPESEHSIFPGLFGLRLPSYDRTNGLSLPVSASIVVGKMITVDPRLTYRSQLGRIDPSLDIIDSLGRASAISVSGGRGTFTNDAWFRSDVINTVEALSVGNDARNYFRGFRAEAKFAWQSDTGNTFDGLYAGVRGEHALSTRPNVDAHGGPWSLFGRHGEDDMLRVNPAVDNGVTKSVILGAAVFRPDTDVAWRASLDIELGHSNLDGVAHTPGLAVRNFIQTTFDGHVAFPTFGAQSIQFHGHAVATSHGVTPRQRWAYLGGSGTLPTVDMFSLGGDQLVYVEGQYAIPISSFDVPLLGPPVIFLRDATGGAAVGEFPELHQNIGIRLGFGPMYVGFAVDPATRRWHFDGGFSLPR